MRVVVLLVSFLCFACSSSRDAAPRKRDPGACAPVMAVAETRQGKPGPGAPCDDSTKACAGGDVGSCYLAGVCAQTQWTPLKGKPEAAPVLDAALAAYQVACTGGIVEGCLARAGLRLESGATPKDTCDDLVRACQLGDELHGCARCLRSHCAR